MSMLESGYDSGEARQFPICWSVVLEAANQLGDVLGVLTTGITL